MIDGNTLTHKHSHTEHSLFRSESPSQVFLIIIQWLVSLVKANGGRKQHVVLAYDNMCNLAKLKAAKAPLPFPPPLDKLWLDVEKVIRRVSLQEPRIS